VLSFDCYGTLVDWETGIVRAVRPILAAHGKKLADAEILAMYSPIERELEKPPHRSYREVLRGIVQEMGRKLGFTPSTVEMEALPESVGTWLPFPDTVVALRALSSRYKLAIISNIDDDMIALTAAKLGVAFEAIVTAQQAGSYKPSRRNFELALERIGLPREQVLHCAESRHHDVAPARALGMATVWVNRAQGRPSASGEDTARPNLEVGSMKELAERATK
jgi:2-haloacid dehalogenase